MVIPGVRGPPSVAGASARRRSASAGFSVPGGDAAGPADAAAATSAGLGGLLALQEAAGPDAAGRAQAKDQAADRAALEQGQAAMEEMGQLQADLLAGRPGAAAARLAACLDAMAAGPQAADPRLAAVLGALRLRAAVETARAGLRSGSDIEKPSAPNA